MTAATRSYTRRRRLPYAAAVAAVVTVAGCSGGDPGPAVTTPPVSTTVTTSATTPATTSTTPIGPTTSVDPVLAKIPAAARKDNEEGGTAYVRYYFKELNLAFRSADSSVIEQLASPDCITCVAFSDGVKQLKKQGRRYGADLVKVSNASALNFTDGNRQVLLDINQQSVPVLNDAGAKVSVTPWGTASFVASLAFGPDRWTISRLQKVKS